MSGIAASESRPCGPSRPAAPAAEGEIEMRLLTFTLGHDAAHRVGVVRPDGHVVDLWETGRKLSPLLPFDPADMLSLIAAGAPALERIRSLLAAPREPLRLEALRLLAPIPRPRKNLFCVGWNYLDHFEEGARVSKQQVELPKYPAFFTRAPTTVIGPHESIAFDPAVSEKIDWEVELAIVIGRAGKDIREEEAFDHV